MVWPLFFVWMCKMAFPLGHDLSFSTLFRKEVPSRSLIFVVIFVTFMIVLWKESPSMLTIFSFDSLKFLTCLSMPSLIVFWCNFIANLYNNGGSFTYNNVTSWNICTTYKVQMLKPFPLETRICCKYEC